jgi:hypothetical protein
MMRKELVAAVKGNPGAGELTEKNADGAGIKPKSQ